MDNRIVQLGIPGLFFIALCIYHESCATCVFGLCIEIRFYGNLDKYLGIRNYIRYDILYLYKGIIECGRVLASIQSQIYNTINEPIKKQSKLSIHSMHVTINESIDKTIPYNLGKPDRYTFIPPISQSTKSSQPIANQETKKSSRSLNLRTPILNNLRAHLHNLIDALHLNIHNPEQSIPMLTPNMLNMPLPPLRLLLDPHRLSINT